VFFILFYLPVDLDSDTATYFNGWSKTFLSDRLCLPLLWSAHGEYSIFAPF